MSPPGVCGGEMIRAPVEMIETYYPWRVLHYEMLTDSAGPGRFRCGMGIHWEGVNEGGKAILLTGDSDGDVTRGYAIDGGKTPDFFNSLKVTRGETSFGVHAHRRADLEMGDVVIQKTAGGCGVGDPFDRVPESVLQDVVCGYVSVGRAETDYGVVLTADGRAIDAAATAKLRRAHRVVQDQRAGAEA